MKNFISPSLICGNHLNLESDLIELSNAKEVGMLHVDVMDGHFVPRYGMYPEQVVMIRQLCEVLKFDVPINAHLMVSNPEPYIEKFSDADYITVPVENNLHLSRTIRMIKETGCKVGLAFNIHSTKDILEYVIQPLYHPHSAP